MCSWLMPPSGIMPRRPLPRGKVSSQMLAGVVYHKRWLHVSAGTSAAAARETDRQKDNRVKKGFIRKMVRLQNSGRTQAHPQKKQKTPEMVHRQAGRTASASLNKTRRKRKDFHPRKEKRPCPKEAGFVFGRKDALVRKEETLAALPPFPCSKRQMLQPLATTARRSPCHECR